MSSTARTNVTQLLDDVPCDLVRVAVFDQDTAQPVPGALVSAVPLPPRARCKGWYATLLAMLRDETVGGERVRRTRTDADGVAIVHGDGGLLLCAETPGRIASCAIDCREERAVRLWLAPEVQAEVHVVDGRGVPLRDVPIAVIAEERRADPWVPRCDDGLPGPASAGVTDDAGRLRLRVVDRLLAPVDHVHRLVAFVDALGLRDVRAELHTDAPTELVVPGHATLTMRLLDREGLPLGRRCNVSVRIEWLHRGGEGTNETADFDVVDAGVPRIVGLGGAFMASADAGVHVPCRQRIEGATANGQQLQIELRVSPNTSRIHGRALDENGGLFANELLRVRAKESPFESVFGEGWYREVSVAVTTDAEGRFALYVDPIAWPLRCSFELCRDADRAVRSAPFFVGPTADSGLGDVVLQPAPVFANGRVTCADAPVPRLQLSMQPDDAGVRIEVRPDGAFWCRGALTPGVGCELTAWAPGYASQTVEFTSPGRDLDVELLRDEPLLVRCRVPAAVLPFAGQLVACIESRDGERRQYASLRDVGDVLVAEPGRVPSDDCDVVISPVGSNVVFARIASVDGHRCDIDLRGRVDVLRVRLAAEGRPMPMTVDLDIHWGNNSVASTARCGVANVIVPATDVYVVSTDPEWKLARWHGLPGIARLTLQPEQQR